MSTMSKKLLSASALAVAALGATTAMSAQAAPQDFTIHGQINNGWNAWYSNNTNFNTFTIAGTSNYSGANSGVFIQNGTVNQLVVNKGAQIGSAKGTGLGLVWGATQSATFNGATITAPNADAILVGGNNANATWTFTDTTVTGHNALRLADGAMGNIFVNGASVISGDSCGFALNGNVGDISVAKAAQVSGGSFGIWTNKAVGSVMVAGRVTSAQSAMTFDKGANVGAITIQNGGMVSGGTTGIANSGTVASLYIEHGAQLTAKQTALYNKGTFGDIKVGGKIGNIVNEGTVNGRILVWQEGSAGNITVQGNGQINAGNQSAIGFGGYTQVGDVTLKDSARVESNSFGLESWSQVGNVSLANNATLTSNKNSAIRNYKTGVLKRLTLSDNAQVTSQADVAIWSAGNVTEGIQLKNQSVAKGATDGVWIAGVIGATDGVAIHVADNAQVIAGDAAIQNADNGWTRTGTINGDIVVDQDAALKGTYGLYNAVRGTINGNVKVAGTTDAILNEGHITGDVAVTGSIANAFTNRGTIAGNVQLVTDSAANFNFENAAGAQIGKSVAITLGHTGASAQNSVVNAGHIAGDLTVSSQATALESGTLTNTVINASGGQIDGNLVIKASNTRVSNDGNIDGYLIVGASNVQVDNFNTLSAQKSAPKTIFLGSDNALARSASTSSVSIDNLIVGVDGNSQGQNTLSTVDVQGSGLVKNVKQVTIGAIGEDFHLGQAIELNDILTTADGVSTNGTTPQQVVLSKSLSAAGYALNTLADGSVVATRSLANTAGAIVGKVIGSQIVRRDMQIDSMISNEAKSFQKTGVAAFAQLYGSKDGYNTFGSDITGNTYGVLVGANVGVADDVVITGYAGYEMSQNKGQFAQGQGELDMSTQYVGVNATKRLTMDNAWTPFIQAGAKLAYTSNEVTRTIEGKSTTDRPNTWNYGVGVTVGADYALSSTSVLTPSVGFSYGAITTSDFNLGTSESYDLDQVNLLMGQVGLTWSQTWSKDLSSQVAGGVRYNFAPNGQTIISGTMADEYSLASAYEYLNVAVNYNVTDHSIVSVGYQGSFDRMGSNHGAMVKFEQLF